MNSPNAHMWLYAAGSLTKLHPLAYRCWLQTHYLLKVARNLWYPKRRGSGASHPLQTEQRAWPSNQGRLDRFLSTVTHSKYCPRSECSPKTEHWVNFDAAFPASLSANRALPVYLSARQVVLWLFSRWSQRSQTCCQSGESTASVRLTLRWSSGFLEDQRQISTVSHPSTTCCWCLRLNPLNRSVVWVSSLR